MSNVRSMFVPLGVVALMAMVSIIRGDSTATHVYVAALMIIGAMVSLANFLLEALRIHTAHVIHAIAQNKKGG